MGIRVLGIDPGLRSLGWAIVEQRPSGLRVERCGVLRTQPAKKKLKVPKGVDLDRRCTSLTVALISLLRGDISLVCIESIAFPVGRVQVQVASALGRVRGIVGALAQVYDVKVVELTPQQLKRSIAGKKDASKEEVIAAVERLFPDIAWPAPASVVEHAADAVAAAVDGHAYLQAKRSLGLEVA